MNFPSLGGFMVIKKRPSRKEIVVLGKRIYEERLRAEAERDHPGEFLTIDVQSGDFAIAASDSEASLQLLNRRPEAVIYGVRIGDAVAYRFGFTQAERR
jgi:hypothetical protein